MRANGGGTAAGPTRWRSVETDDGVRIDLDGNAKRWAPVARTTRDERYRIRVHDEGGRRSNHKFEGRRQTAPNRRPGVARTPDA